MTTLMIRGYVSRINMSTEGNGIYNVASYEVGLPEYEIENDPMSKAMCIDTISLNIVAKSRPDIVRAIGKLYKSLTEAVSFYHRLTDIPCYLESLTSEQVEPVWAGIKAFSFHELNDPYDNINGKIVQDASLVITREPWSNVPPQDSPFEITNAMGTDISENRLIAITNDARAENIYSAAYPQITAGTADEMLFITNFWRRMHINSIHTTSNNPANQQPGTYSSPYSFGYVPSATKFEFVIGIHDEESVVTPFIDKKGYFNALVFKLSKALDREVNDDDNGVLYEYWNALNDQWISNRPYPDYSYFHTIGQYYMHLQNRSDATTMENSLNGSFYKFSMTTATGMNAQSIPKQTDYLVYAPSRPYIDILTPPGGDLPTKLQFKIASMNEWPVFAEGSDFGSQILYDKEIMNTLIVTSQRITRPDRQPVHPGLGIYTLGPGTYTLGENVEMNTVLTDPLYSHTPGTWYAHHTVDHSSPNVDTILVETEDMSSDVFYTYASKQLDIQPGTYRVFVRYYVMDNLAAGGCYMRVSSTNAQPTGWYSTFGQQYIETGYRTHSRIYGIDYDLDYHTDTECLADLGSIQVGSSSMRNPGSLIESTTRFFVELKKRPAAAGNILLMDLILLPMNHSFTVCGGSRSPLPRHGHRSEQDQIEPKTVPDLVGEFLYLTEFEPGGTIASTAARFRYGGEEVAYAQRVIEDYFISGGNRLVTDQDYGRRFYFLWYKKLPNGVIYSASQFNSGIQVYGAKQYLTLPAQS